MAGLWVKTVRSDGGGIGDKVFVNGQYVDPAGRVGTAFLSESGTNTFDTLDASGNPDWRRRKRIEPEPDNSENNPIMVMLERIAALPPG